MTDTTTIEGLPQPRISKFGKFEKGYSMFISSKTLKYDFYSKKTGEDVKIYEPYSVYLKNRFRICVRRCDYSTKYGPKYIARDLGSSIVERFRIMLYGLNTYKDRFGSKKPVFTNNTYILFKVSNEYFPSNDTASGYLVLPRIAFDDVTEPIEMRMTHIYYDPYKDSVTVSVKFPQWKKLRVHTMLYNETIQEAARRIAGERKKKLPPILEEDTIRELLEELEEEAEVEHWD